MTIISSRQWRGSGWKPQFEKHTNVGIIFTNNYSWVVKAENALPTLLPPEMVNVTRSNVFCHFRLRCFRASALWEAWSALSIEVWGQSQARLQVMPSAFSKARLSKRETETGQKISSRKQINPMSRISLKCTAGSVCNCTDHYIRQSFLQQTRGKCLSNGDVSKSSANYIFIELISENVMSGWGHGGPSAQKHISTSGHWLLATLQTLCFHPHYPPFSAKCLLPRRKPLYIHLLF